MGDSAPSKTTDIRLFITKTCSTFDSLVQFNNQMVVTLNELKQLGDSIISSLDSESKQTTETSIACTSEVTNFILNGPEKILKMTQDQTSQVIKITDKANDIEITIENQDSIDSENTEINPDGIDEVELNVENQEEMNGKTKIDTSGNIHNEMGEEMNEDISEDQNRIKETENLVESEKIEVAESKSEDGEVQSDNNEVTIKSLAKAPLVNSPIIEKFSSTNNRESAINNGMGNKYPDKHVLELTPEAQQLQLAPSGDTNPVSMNEADLDGILDIPGMQTPDSNKFHKASEDDSETTAIMTENIERSESGSPLHQNKSKKAAYREYDESDREDDRICNLNVNISERNYTPKHSQSLKRLRKTRTPKFSSSSSCSPASNMSDDDSENAPSVSMSKTIRNSPVETSDLDNSSLNASSLSSLDEKDTKSKRIKRMKIKSIEKVKKNSKNSDSSTDLDEKSDDSADLMPEYRLPSSSDLSSSEDEKIGKRATRSSKRPISSDSSNQPVTKKSNKQASKKTKNNNSDYEDEATDEDYSDFKEEAEEEIEESKEVEAGEDSNRSRGLDSPGGESKKKSQATTEIKPKNKRKKKSPKYIPESVEEIISCSEDKDIDEETETRHKLRKVLDEEKLEKTTKDAAAAELERRKRVEEKRKKLNESLESFSLSQNTEIVSEDKNLFLDISKTGEKRIPVDKNISGVLKPHQIEGLQFMWDSCFENIELIAEGHQGSGCLLAHCMGLGKTLQVISLVHTLLVNQELTKVFRVLILMPVNVQVNWKNEFKKWTSKCHTQVTVLDFNNSDKYATDKTRARLKVVERWNDKGGVFLMGYTMFANHVFGKRIKNKSMRENYANCLLGADLVICDEGHMLKNEKTNIAKACFQVKTQRRIVLTGTPLQNNLIEYHCMVSFVKPNLLGTKKEFSNRFANPIMNGQHRDSTVRDVKIMKKRAHVLHDLLDGCVQRKDYEVIRNLLPDKHEYVLMIRLSNKQVELYRKYLAEQLGVKNLKTASGIGKLGGMQLFVDFQTLSRIWTHPWVMRINEARVALIESRSAKNFIDDESSAVETDDEPEKKVPMIKKDPLFEEAEEIITGSGKKKNRVIDSDESDIMIIEESSTDSVVHNKKKNESSDEEKISAWRSKRRSTKEETNGHAGKVVNNIDSDVSEATDKSDHWWNDIVTPDCEFELEFSGKLVVFEQVLRLCEERKDKLIVFSQSLMSLDLIEKFLNHFNLSGQNWKKEVDYFRLDGSTEMHKRAKDSAIFNDPKKTKARLYLISTRAGGIGINLVGANRCIVFDASWNPSYDTQSIFRIYRFGQKKPVYIYRFLSHGTMEEKIYQRQVNKQSLAQRVVDEHQLDRHFTSEELRDLYKFEPGIYDPEKYEVPIMPEDEILRVLLSEQKHWISSYHEHESLLENKLNEGLSAEDRQAAWNEYEAEKNRLTNQARTFSTYEEYLAANPQLLTAPGGPPNGNDPMQYGNLDYAQQMHLILEERRRQQREQEMIGKILYANNHATNMTNGLYMDQNAGTSGMQNDATNMVTRDPNNDAIEGLKVIYFTSRDQQARRQALQALYTLSPQTYKDIISKKY